MAPYHLPILIPEKRDGHGDHPLPGPSVRGFYPHESFRPHHIQRRSWQERLAPGPEVLVVAGIALLAGSVIGFVWLAVWAVSALRHIGGA